MGLIDLKTNLKSLKYGQDKPGGGQPFIVVDINNPDNNPLVQFDDGFIRGGTAQAIKSSTVDSIRISKFLTTLPYGPLFVNKQIGLQLTNPRLEWVKGGPLNSIAGGFDNQLAASTNGLLEPTRLYNLGLNTLAQIPVNAFGLHFTRHGLSPVQDDNSKYYAVAISNNQEGGINNRLVGYKNKFGLGSELTYPLVESVGPGLDIIDEYPAGPGSVYGIGSTTIRRYDFTEDGTIINNAFKNASDKAKTTQSSLNYYKDLGVSKLYFKNQEIIDTVDIDSANPTAKPSHIDQSVFEYSTAALSATNPIIAKYQELRGIVESQISGSSTFVNISGSTYAVNEYNILNTSITKVLKGVPDGPIVRANYKRTQGKIVYYNGYGDTIVINGSWDKNNRQQRVGSGRRDSLNLTPLFEANAGTITDNAPLFIPGANVQTINDLVKFRIQAINTDNPSKATWMIFRAYITSFSDSVDAEWGQVKYAGRGENFFIYNGFNRKVSIGFKVAALSAIEMKPMYQKLNFLMSNLMPDYTQDGDGGLMRGPLVKLTLGNWFDGQDGLLNSLTYNVPNESPWEIAINTVDGYEPLILPHVVEVNMTFTPIGSQTGQTNIISAKGADSSNIAQNWNGTIGGKETQYIDGKIANL